MMKGIKYLILQVWLFFLFALATLPVLWGAGALIKYFDASQWKALTWLFVAIILGWFFGGRWIVNKTAHHIAFENMMFWDAVKCTLNEGRLRLAFLPWVGHWFAPNTNDPDDDDSVA